MKVLVEVTNKEISNYIDSCDALLLGLENFSVLNSVTFSLTEIREIINKYPEIQTILLEVNKSNKKAINFYKKHH